METPDSWNETKKLQEASNTHTHTHIVTGLNDKKPKFSSHLSDLAYFPDLFIKISIAHFNNYSSIPLNIL